MVLWKGILFGKAQLKKWFFLGYSRKKVMEKIKPRYLSETYFIKSEVKTRKDMIRTI